MMQAVITGTGSALPRFIVTNEMLEQIMDTSDAWIRERTGICQRRLAKEETALELSATGTPDHVFPSLACSVQAELGAKQAAAFDLSAACSGFLYALSAARAYIMAGLYRRILIIGADLMSRAVDWNDRSTAVLFGDGAGAVVVEADDSGAYGILDVELGADGTGRDALICKNRANADPFGEQAENRYGFLRMDGQAVYRFAVTRVPALIRSLLDRAGCVSADHYLLHQANERIIRSAAKRLGEPIEKFPMNLQRVGNMSAASIPVLLDEENRAGRLAKGERLVLAGFGAGLTFGAALVIWGK